MSWTISPQYRDPDYSNVSLLLHGDGANGSTTITDSSPTPKTVTPTGNAQISTAIADPFGNSTGVLAFDGTGDYLLTSASSDFTLGTGDFTMECWIYPANTNAGYRSIIIDNRYGPGTGFGFYHNGTSLEFWHSNPSTQIILATNAITAAVWQHVAVARSGSSNRAFVNGIQVGSTATNSNDNDATYVVIGKNPVSAALDFNGYIDDLRITKGIARYTSNFTLPTAPFPDI